MHCKFHDGSGFIRLGNYMQGTSDQLRVVPMERHQQVSQRVIEAHIG